ncbi:uncharacterized protein METZ01_LOCUS45617 [marine metagenome]|uniref:Uncharacterized protein n=1 Tax=marine metagenome TaxID=408172 RepID=A0A381RV11_9ZZZZ
MSKIEVDKVDPQSGTALEIGTSGDTITVPTGAGLTVVDEVKTNKISPATGVAFTLGDSGDTFTVPSGATFSNLGTATGFAAISWASVVTGSTLTAVAGNAYPIDTTANACTVTLPASGTLGDQIIFTDYARYWATNNITLDTNSLNFQGSTASPIYNTNGDSILITYIDATQGWIPIYDDNVRLGYVVNEVTQKAIFGYGSGPVSITNLVNSSGVIGADVTGVGTARSALGATSYGGDKAIFGFGDANVTNLVSNAGVVATDVAGVGTSRSWPSASGYGLTGQALFIFGTGSSIINKVSDTGVVASDITGVGTNRYGLAAASYGGDKAICAYGYAAANSNLSNLVSNTGVVSADVAGVGTARRYCGAASYGAERSNAIFGFGYVAGTVNMTNLVGSNGVIGSDVSGVGTARYQIAAASFGGDKAIFGYGDTADSNLVSNTGVVASDVTAVGTSRQALAAANYSYSA